MYFQDLVPQRGKHVVLYWQSQLTTRSRPVCASLGKAKTQPPPAYIAQRGRNLLPFRPAICPKGLRLPKGQLPLRGRAKRETNLWAYIDKYALLCQYITPEGPEGASAYCTFRCWKAGGGCVLALPRDAHTLAPLGQEQSGRAFRLLCLKGSWKLYSGPEGVLNVYYFFLPHISSKKIILCVVKRISCIPKFGYPLPNQSLRYLIYPFSRGSPHSFQTKKPTLLPLWGNGTCCRCPLGKRSERVIAPKGQRIGRSPKGAADTTQRGHFILPQGGPRRGLSGTIGKAN